MKHLLLTSLLAIFLIGCDDKKIIDTLKKHKIISSIEDIEFLPNQIRKEFDWGFIIYDAGLYKLANKDGKITTPTGFKWMPRFDDNGVAIIQNPESRYGLINYKGEYLIEDIYDKISNFNSLGLAIISKSSEYTDQNGNTQPKRTQGLIDRNGIFKIEPEYFNITYLEDLELYVIDHNSYREGKSKIKESLYSASKGWIDNATFDSIGKFKSGLAIVKKDGKSGVINSKGDIVIPLIYEYVFEETEGLIRVSNNELTAFFDRFGNIIIPFMDNRAGSFDHGVSIVHSKKSNRSQPKLALMNKEGSLITDFQFSEIKTFTYIESLDKTLAFAKPLKGRLGGLIDTSGNYIISPIFTNITEDRNGYFTASYYVFETQSSNKTLNYIIDASENIFINIDHKNPDLSKPEIFGKIGLIDRNRKIVSKPIYDDAIASYSNTIKVKEGIYWGVVNNKNEILLPIEYKKIEIITPELALVKSGEMWGAKRITDGKMLLPIEYQQIEILAVNKLKGLKANKWETVDL